jgi:hypothetical protein
MNNISTDSRDAVIEEIANAIKSGLRLADKTAFMSGEVDEEINIDGYFDLRLVAAHVLDLIMTKGLCHAERRIEHGLNLP